MFRSGENRSLFHDHPHPRGHHGSSVFGLALSRLRPALYYFTTAVVITTFFYCLLFYEPENNRHHSSLRRFRAHYGPASPLISPTGGSVGASEDASPGAGHLSAAFLLEEFICNALLHFADNYAGKIPLVPSLLESDSLLVVGPVSPSNHTQHHQRNLLGNTRYDTVQQLQPNGSNTQITKDERSSTGIHFIGEEDNLAEEDEDYLALIDEPDSVEHYLEELGFNIRHITRYLLHLNQSTQNITTRSTKRSNKRTTTRALGLSKSPQASNSPLPLSILPSSPQSNLSSINDILELLNSIVNSSNGNSTLIFVSAVNSNQYSMAYRFIKSFERYRQINSEKRSETQAPLHLRLMIYDLGLTEDQLFEIETLCNQTWKQSVSSLCKIRTFNYSNYPSHVSDLKIAAYRSIILQEMLRDIRRAHKHISRLSEMFQIAAVQTYNLFWLDPHYRFLPGTIQHHPTLLADLLASTRNISGIRSWSIEAPTSALTHPRTCEYFHSTADNFYFHRMVRSSHLVVSISEATWQPFELGIMLPWVRCALTEGCIAPLGSQFRSSCRLDKKPHYRYSGCHHYDMSALNVLLGIAYNFTSSQYSAPPSSQFFAPFYKMLKTRSSSSPSTQAASEDNSRPAILAASKLAAENFDYTDYYDPGESVRRDELSLLESEDRFDRVLTDDDLPEEQRRPRPKRPPSILSSLGASSSSSIPFLHSSSSFLSSPSPEEDSMQLLNQKKSL